ncbi:MAG: hypothetical protein JNM28_01825 [Armatimonadetes bacterium]|nr:hypothetical protein [Armatimonadota bacterium]MBS1710954.1 hypothetical protein [Armatimonadota bacterium]MBX3108626.1 hypothetical protein [Fimbriimonadaceae bacterium]
MSENMEKFRHLDGNMAVVDQEFVKITFQHGDPAEAGVNGCRIEDVIDILVEKLLDFQGRDLTCEENATALYHLDLAREALLLRRRRRENQGLIGQRAKHQSQ